MDLDENYDGTQLKAIHCGKEGTFFSPDNIAYVDGKNIINCLILIFL